MEKVLGQDEIDSMFAAIREESAKVGETSAPERKKELYNFSRAGQISNEQMEAISTVNDLFARNLTHNLGAWLRTQFEVNLASAEQMTYSEFTERIPEPAYVCSARLEPLDVLGVVQLDLAMAPPIVDLLLGGVGRAGPLREPTDIEDAILLSVMEIVLRELNLAWQPVGLKVRAGQARDAGAGAAPDAIDGEDTMRQLRDSDAGGAGVLESMPARGSAQHDSPPADRGEGQAAAALAGGPPAAEPGDGARRSSVRCCSFRPCG